MNKKNRCKKKTKMDLLRKELEQSFENENYTKILQINQTQFQEDNHHINYQPENNEIGNEQENDEMGNEPENNEMGNEQENNEIRNEEENDEMGNEQENDEMGNEQENNEMRNEEENDEMGNEQENNEIRNEEENDEMGNEQENDEMGNEQENNEMRNEEENDEMGNEEENDEMGNEEENDEMGNEEENDEMGNEEENDEMGNEQENDEMGNEQENDEMRNEQENDEMRNEQENDEMRNEQENDEMGNEEDLRVEYGLEEKGYLFLKSVYSKDVVDRFYYEVQSFLNLEGIYSHLQKRQDVPQQRYFVNNTYGALQNFNQLQHYYVSVIDNRGTYNRVTDVGVIDFFNVDRLFPQVKTYFDVNVMQAILLKTTGIEWKLTRTNLQIYNNVINTNQFHVDTGNEKNMKFTIFMSNILDEMNGAPAFIEGSHINKKNIKLSQSKIFTGERGAVLISYQNGYHRKMPMKIGGTNVFLTFHFTTKYDRDRYLPL